ncbi:LamG domain-containing protein [Kordia sp. YSTF-M3]|uniref:LamG domain-containing protein n=1 Tax=Kordia aestuariivivens TaxID=2759037 RepID=A0ABR7Q6U7_9FLAO|nr:LamG domain-containing protein [Kordia aestuariivivens]MBC8754213.1 LamG domain-containing protein [Kordia aestuariivivens]
MLNKIPKTGLLILILFIFSCNSSDDATEEQVINCIPGALQNGIIAFYPFNNGSINDFSGNGYNLTNTSTASSGTDRDGNLDCAFNFTAGNNEFLEYANPAFLDNFQNAPFSISLWYNPTGTDWSFEVPMKRSYVSDCQNHTGQWAIILFDCRRAVFEVNQNYIWSDYYNTDGCIETTLELSNTWQHLTVTYDGATGLELYRNGVSTTDIIAGTSNSCGMPPLGDLILGEDFNGLLDDIIIYDHVLSQSEITTLYNLPGCCL